MNDDINRAYRALGMAVVQDACEEWVENAERIYKLKVKQKVFRLTSYQESVLAGLIGRNLALERFIMSDWGETLSGLDGKVIVEKLKERTSKW